MTTGRRLGALLLAITVAAPLAAAAAPGRAEDATTPNGDGEAEVLAAVATPTAPSPTPTPPSAPSPTRQPVPTARPPLVAPTPAVRLDDELERALAEAIVAVEFSVPNVRASVTVSYDGTTITASNGSDPMISASLAKTYWVVAAVAAEGIDAVAPHAEPIFAVSDNDAAGSVIDVIGIDAINAYTRSLGMDDTFLSGWAYGRPRFAVDRPTLGTSNLTSTGDAVTLLDALAAGELLGPAETFVVLEWMRHAPDRQGPEHEWGAVLVEHLSPGVAARVAHKAGWLPPGCCRDIDNVVLAAGIVPLPNGGTFTVAVAAADGDDFEAQAAWISATVATVYDLLASRATGDGDATSQ